jgi:hypothetical protein
MGIRLVMEAASRHAPEGLTWRERYALMVLAASAIDATRELQPGIEDSPELIARLRLGRNERFAVLKALCEKGALVRLERGRNGVKAAYAIAPFAAVPRPERPGEPDAPPVENQAADTQNPDATDRTKDPGSTSEGSGFTPSKDPGSAEHTSYKGIRGFKTGGKTPSGPRQSPLLMAVPSGSPEEGEIPAGQSTLQDRQALAVEIRNARPDWSTRSILRALDRPAVAERPWAVTAEALRIVAADSGTLHAGRLEHDGPWWAEASRRVQPSRGRHAAPGGAHRYDRDPETGLCAECRAPEVDRIHRRWRTA